MRSKICLVLLPFGMATPKAKEGSLKVASEDHCLEGQSLLPQEPGSALMYLHLKMANIARQLGNKGKLKTQQGFPEFPQEKLILSFCESFRSKPLLLHREHV